MSRQPRYRVWNGVQMYYPETKTVDGNYTVLSVYYSPTSIGWALYDHPLEARKASGEYHNLMQSLGIQDMDSNEIWEGDIRKFRYGIGYIVWDAPFFWVKSPGSQAMDLERSDVLKGSKLLGNIYEHPKLIDKIIKKQKF